MPPKIYSVFFYHCCKNYDRKIQNKHLVTLTNHKGITHPETNNQDKNMKKPRLIIMSCLRDIYHLHEINSEVQVTGPAV